MSYTVKSDFGTRFRYQAPYTIGIIMAIVIIIASIIAIITLFSGGIVINHQINPDGSRMTYPGGYVVAMSGCGLVIIIAIIVAVWYARLGKQAASV